MLTLGGISLAATLAALAVQRRHAYLLLGVCLLRVFSQGAHG
jgi:hypothetical protein